MWQNRKIIELIPNFKLHNAKLLNIHIRVHHSIDSNFWIELSVFSRVNLMGIVCFGWCASAFVKLLWNMCFCFSVASCECIEVTFRYKTFCHTNSSARNTFPRNRYCSIRCKKISQSQYERVYNNFHFIFASRCFPSGFLYFLLVIVSMNVVTTNREKKTSVCFSVSKHLDCFNMSMYKENIERNIFVFTSSNQVFLSCFSLAFFLLPPNCGYKTIRIN